MLKNKWTRLIFISLVLCCLLYVFHEPILNSLARQLVYKDAAIKPSDAIVVLMGDKTGERLETGITLFKKGFGEYIVFWGGPIYWKVTYGELCLRQLRKNGIKPGSAVWSEEKLSDNSTAGESQVIMKLLKKKGARSFILVTSPYHSARARRVYVPLARDNGMTIYVYPSERSDIKIEGWWKDRESAKNIFIEFQKTVWYMLFH